MRSVHLTFIFRLVGVCLLDSGKNFRENEQHIPWQIKDIDQRTKDEVWVQVLKNYKVTEIP